MGVERRVYAQAATVDGLGAFVVSGAQTVEPLVDKELIDPSEPITLRHVLASLAGANSRSVLRRWFVPTALTCLALTVGVLVLRRWTKAMSLPARRQLDDGRRPRATLRH